MLKLIIHPFPDKVLHIIYDIYVWVQMLSMVVILEEETGRRLTQLSTQGTLWLCGKKRGIFFKVRGGTEIGFLSSINCLYVIIHV